MAEQKRVRRSERHIVPPERVSQAAERMRAEGNATSGFPPVQQIPSGGASGQETGAWSRPSRGPQQTEPQNRQGYAWQPPYAPQQPYAQDPAYGQQGYGRMSGGSQAYDAQAAYLAQQQAMQQQAMQQQAMQQQAMEQQYAAMRAQEKRRRAAQQTEERQRVSEETSSRGAFRGYTGAQTAVNPVQQEPVPPPPPKKEKHTLAVIAFLLLALAVLTGGAFAGMSYFKNKQIQDAVSPYDNLFCQGVYVDGIHLGGMTREQALNSIQSQIQQRNDAWKVRLTYQDATVAEINANMLGMSVDVGHVMDEAWAQGHTGDTDTRYAAMQALLEKPYEAYTAVPSGDTSVIDGVLAELKNRLEKPAVNATLVAFDPAEPYPFTFSAEEEGRTLDTAELRETLYHMVATMTGGSVPLVPDTVEPEVRVVDLQKHYMLRSSVYTPISTSSTDDRNNNIRRAFEFINGMVIYPGSQFSFNDTVGERTEANGWFPATEYVYGEHVEGFGGGVCQASTTLYQAAVCAGLQIVKRTPHSDAVAYTEYGKDATVYWYGKRKIDLVFRNNSEGPIYLVAAVQADPSNRKRLIAKVTIYGEDMGDVRYELESEITEELPAPEKPEYVRDTKATYVTYTDQEKSVAKARTGYVVDSWRVEYVGNVVNERVHLYTDTYEPKAEKIYVGVTKREE